MKLPNGDRATINMRKLRHYALDPRHPHGRHHARLFRDLLKLSADDAPRLAAWLRRLAASHDVTLGKPSPFGQKYELRAQWQEGNASYTVLSVWMIHHGEHIPRLVTTYVI